MTARYLHPGAGTCGRPRAVHTPEEVERRKRRHQDRHNERRRRSRAGADPSEWPSDLHVQEYPR